MKRLVVLCLTYAFLFETVSAESVPAAERLIIYIKEAKRLVDSRDFEKACTYLKVAHKIATDLNADKDDIGAIQNSMVEICNRFRKDEDDKRRAFEKQLEDRAMYFKKEICPKYNSAIQACATASNIPDCMAIRLGVDFVSARNICT